MLREQACGRHLGSQGLPEQDRSGNEAYMWFEGFVKDALLLVISEMMEEKV
jgi:hypothetical protein